MTPSIPQHTDTHQGQDLYRYAIRDPEQHEAWTLVRVKSSNDSELLGQGYNVAGATLDLGQLDTYRRLKLLALLAMPRSQQSPEQASAEAEILRLVPRVRVPGIDIDVGDEQLSRSHARRIRVAFAHKGVPLRESWSGPNGRRHLEWGDAVTPQPDLHYAMLGLVRKMLRAEGYQPRAGAPGGQHLSCQWVMPDDPGGSAGFVDLVCLNRSAESRGSLFRLLGGLHKTRKARKRIWPGQLRPETGPVDADLYAEGISAYHEQLQAAGVVQGERKPGKPRVKRTYPNIKSRKELGPLVHVLQRHAKPGDHHEIRLALCAVAQTRSLLDREDWISVMGEAWGDPFDARAAWDSTEIRLRQERRCMGLGYLRKRCGTSFMDELTGSLATVTSKPRTSLNSRMGVGVLAPDLAAGIEAYLPRELRARVRRALHCGRFCQTEGCDLCLETKSQIVRRCQVTELCHGCSILKRRDMLSACPELWKGDRYMIVHKDYPDRQAALKARVDSTKHAPKGKKPIGIVSPQRGGTWRVTLVAARLSTADSLGMSLGGAHPRELDKREALNVMDQELARRHVEVMDHLEHGRPQEAAGLITELYRTQDMPGACNSELPWLSAHERADMRRDAWRRRWEEDSEACECPEDQSHSVYSYHDIKSGQMLAEKQRVPLGMDALIDRYQALIFRGTLQPERVEHSQPLRL